MRIPSGFGLILLSKQNHSHRILCNKCFVWVIFMWEKEREGVCVAVLDTGIYKHRDFGDRILEFKDFVGYRAMPYDDNSHGTHVAGIIAGDGSASNGKYVGVAMKSKIIAIKVLDKLGEGDCDNVMKGLEWVIDNKNKYDIRIVNLSFGTVLDEKYDEDSCLVKMVEEVWDSGIVVVTAAGNGGPKSGSITSPGTSRKVITVGAYDDGVYVDGNGKRHNHYSGRGPTKSCIMKPEIVTKGTQIIACTNKRDAYAKKSGTSMSAPIVTGAIALLLEKYPTLSPLKVKMRLHDRAVPMMLSKEHQGWGKLDIDKLLQ